MRKYLKSCAWCVGLLTLATPAVAFASGNGNGFTGQLTWMGGAAILSALFGALAVRMKQTRVLGALIAGLFIGAAFTWTEVVHAIRSPHGAELIKGLAEVAAMLLLFKAGMEGNLKTIIHDAKTGWKVAVLGIVFPTLGGFLYTFYAADVSWTVALFQGGVFAATSVGITAAVLVELGVISHRFAKVIISAAVIDDVAGLMVLSVCQALNSPSADMTAITMQISGAVAFVVIVPVIGHFAAGAILNRMHRLDPAAREAVVLGWAMVYGAAALSVGLAPIVGAYFAGVALEEIYFTNHQEDPEERQVEHFVDKLITAFGPIFFVYAGCIVDPRVFLKPSVLIMGLVFTAIAIAGKLACGLAADKSERLIVGVGMVPRGEVGIIFATIGLQSKILTPDLFGASMIMVLLTTMLTPPLLSILIAKKEKA